MADPAASAALDERIREWRSFLLGRGPIRASDVEELEDHLRGQVGRFVEVGLREDEAFLVAVGRMGRVDALSREFAREHSERLWKQLVLPGDGGPGGSEPDAAAGSRTLWVAVALAVLAALVIKVPALFGIPFDPDRSLFYPLNVAFFTLPFIAAYFAWDRPLRVSTLVWPTAVFALTAALVNAYPFPGTAADARLPDTLILTILHLPLALWLVVGGVYVGGRWWGSGRRMDFVRFTGELLVYLVLIGLGGGVFMGLTLALFRAIGLDVEPVVLSWILPCGIAGAAVIATWLVEAKQSVVENMAPVLARIFTPLFAGLLLAFVLTMAATGRGIDVEREILIAVDLALVVVFGLLLYSISARDPWARPGLSDWIQVGLVGVALLVDFLALWAIAARISDFGFTPNRVAALGMNVVLLVNLAGSAFLYARFLRGATGFGALERWQTAYLPVYSAWGGVVVVAFPPLFGFR